MTTSSLAIDLGLLGDYARAIEMATEAHEGFGQIFHASHPGPWPRPTIWP